MTDDSLAASLDVHMLNHDFLRVAAAMLIEGGQLLHKLTLKLCSSFHIFESQVDVLGKVRAPEECRHGELD